jgi:hypothetical protein
MNKHSTAFLFAGFMIACGALICGVLYGLAFASVWLFGVPWVGMLLGVFVLLVAVGYFEVSAGRI